MTFAQRNFGTKQQQDFGIGSNYDHKYSQGYGELEANNIILRNCPQLFITERTSELELEVMKFVTSSLFLT